MLIKHESSLNQCSPPTSLSLTCGSPAPGDARTIQPIPRERLAEGPLAALRLQTPVAESGGLAGNTRRVVYSLVAPVAEAFRVVCRLNRSYRVSDTGLYQSFPDTKRVHRAILAKRCLVPDARRILVPRVAKAILIRFGHPKRRRVLGAGPVRVVEAKLPREAQPAVPSSECVCPVVLLVIPRIAYALCHVSGVLPRIRVGRTQAVPHVI